MPAFFIYLLKANIALTICYLAYRFGLRRLTFYTTNRFFLLFGIVFAALFPLIDLTRLFNGRAQLAGGISHYTPDWNALQQYLQSSESFTVWDLLQYIFWAGVLVMSVRFFIQLISLWRIHTRSVTGRVNGSRVKIMQQPVNPFSFFRNIYLNPSLHEPEEIDAIIIHEKVHVKGWHSADVMAGELNNIFYWFNPGAWLMKTAIRENLEFIVDRKILQSGMDAKVYQYSLIKVSGVTYAAAIANNFNFSHLKQRIMMMNKKRSGRINILRYVLLLPLVTAIALFMFTSSKGQKGITLNNASSVLRSDTVPPAPIPPPPPPVPASELPKAYRDFLNRNPEVDALAWSTPVNGKATVVRVRLKNGTTEKYHLNDGREMKEAEARYGKFPATPPPPPPPPAPPKPEVKFTPPAPPKPKVKFTPPVIVRDSEPPVSVYPTPVTGREKMRVVIRDPHPENPPLIIVDGKESPSGLKKIDPNNIESVNVLKGATAINKYGEKGRYGVIEITRKNSNQVIQDVITDTAAMSRKPGEGMILRGTTDIAVGGQGEVNHRRQPIQLVTGIAHPDGTTGGAPLYIIDGKEYEKTPDSLYADEIKSISVLKDESAMSTYGKKGKDGVIIIATKKSSK